jgi:hypothetical protein
MRRGLLEDIHPLAQNAPVLTGGGDLRLALDHNEDHFGAARGLARAFARAQPIHREARIAPARRLRRDLVYLAMRAKGFAKKVGHRLCLSG